MAGVVIGGGRSGGRSVDCWQLKWWLTVAGMVVRVVVVNVVVDGGQSGG